jgi:16S rRNA (guanine966-N2)-methyltransferase
MRITSGAWRGRTLGAPAGRAVRPTADRVRQAIFNRLRHGPFFAGGEGGFLEGVAVLDGFAGSGAFGLEALSNGAAAARFLENARPSLAALRANIARLGAEATAGVIAVDATRPPPAPAPHALAFLDPPYRQGLGEAAIAALGARGWFAPSALIIWEEAEGAVTSLPAGCEALDRRRYGDTAVHFLRWAGSGEPGPPQPAG